MLSDYLSVEVYEYLGIRAYHPVILVISIELRAVDAPVKDGRTLVSTFTLANQLLQFLHEKSTCQFITLVKKIIQPFQSNLVGYPFYQVLVEAIHVDRQAYDIMNVFYNKVDAFRYKDLHL